MAAAVVALIGAGAFWLSRPSPIGELRPANLPIALRGTAPEPELTAMLAESAEQARREGGGDWMWRYCVDAVGVLSLPAAPDAGDEWRRDVIDHWANANRYDHGIYKDGGDALHPRNRDDFQFKILPLAKRRDEMQPFERSMMDANADKLLVIAMEYSCPDPYPAWKTWAQSALGLIGAR